MRRFIRLIASRRASALLLSVIVLTWVGQQVYEAHFGQRHQMLGSWQYHTLIHSRDLNVVGGYTFPDKLLSIRGEITFLDNGQFRRFMSIRRGTEEQGLLLAQASVQGTWSLSDQYLSITFENKQLIADVLPQGTESQQLERFLRFFNNLGFSLVHLEQDRLVLRSEAGWVSSLSRL